MKNLNINELNLVTGGVITRPDGGTCTDPLPGQDPLPGTTPENPLQVPILTIKDLTIN